MNKKERLKIRNEAAKIVTEAVDGDLYEIIAEIPRALVILLGRWEDEHQLSMEAVGVAKAILVANRWAELRRQKLGELTWEELMKLASDIIER